MNSCVLCGASGDHLTDEDVIPKWALRAFDIRGPVTISVREEAGPPQQIGKRRSFKVVLDDGLCPACNNVRLSQLENAVKPILAPMAVEPRPTTLSAADQKLLATWAVKTTFLLSLPSARSTQESARSRDIWQVSRKRPGCSQTLNRRHAPWSGSAAGTASEKSP